jgi:putative Mn2+ efflux pump MntP
MTVASTEHSMTTFGARWRMAGARHRRRALVCYKAQMETLEILMVAVGLSMDAFAVSIGASASGRATGSRAAFRLAFHFGLFQFMMPVAGWLIGMSVAPLVVSFDHWIAFTLLSFVGIRMILAGFRPDVEALRKDPSRGWTLVMLSIATSLDALAVGLSLAMIAGPIWYPAIVIGVVTGGLTFAGTRLGTRLGARFGKGMEIAGGIALLTVGVRIVYTHMAS